MQAAKSSQVAAKQARDLISAAEFAAVTATVQENNTDLDLAVAERVTEEALKFVATSGRFPGHTLRPSRIVDEGWHALILHTRIQAALSARLGFFVHHTPEPPDVSRHDPAALARAQQAIRVAGYTPDPTLWVGPTNGSILVAADCEHSEPGGEGTCTGDCSNTGPN